MIKRIKHLAIAVADLDVAVDGYKALLGVDNPRRYEWKADGKTILEKIERARQALARQEAVSKDNNETLH